MPQANIPFMPYLEKKTWNPTMSAGREIDTRGIDLATLRNWMTICTRFHGEHCDWNLKGTKIQTRSAGPLFFIDVCNMKLVPAAQGARYVALSYTWSECLSDCTTSSNIQDLMKDGSFATSTLTVPQVILDTMKLVRDLGEKLLWTDRFCIPQDESPDKQSQLNAMGLIYAGAWLTIIAAQNDDSSRGLFGARKVFDGSTYSMPGSDVKSDLKTKLNFGEEELSNEAVILRNTRTLMCTRWYSRGWTLQESLFSNRRILFHNNSIGWECQRSSWHETQDLSDLLHSRVQPVLNESVNLDELVGVHKTVLSSWPDMFRYSRLVSLYNRRAFTYPEDIFDAFRGALSLLGNSYSGSNISGLPEMFFDATLLWQPWYPMMRRESKILGKDDAILPSWSWTGWCGDFHSESWAVAYSYIKPTHGRGLSSKKVCSWKIVSTVKWYYSEQLKGDRKRINDKSQLCRELANSPTTMEPPGWTRQYDIQGDTCYRHHSSSTDEFWYPIPIISTPKIDTDRLINARFIHGRTRCAVLNVSNIFFTNSSNCNAVDLWNPKDGKWAGVLRLNLNVLDRTRIQTKTCELVELSAGSIEPNRDGNLKRIFDEWSRLHYSNDNAVYEFYNVLCVKWKGQPGSRIAYRKALGRVKKDVWNSLATEIDLTLG
jgi:Heterokaryon incompatibility protein (HET)